MSVADLFYYVLLKAKGGSFTHHRKEHQSVGAVGVVVVVSYVDVVVVVIVLIVILVIVVVIRVGI